MCNEINTDSTETPLSSQWNNAAGHTHTHTYTREMRHPVQTGAFLCTPTARRIPLHRATPSCTDCNVIRHQFSPLCCPTNIQQATLVFCFKFYFKHTQCFLLQVRMHSLYVFTPKTTTITYEWQSYYTIVIHASTATKERLSVILHYYL